MTSALTVQTRNYDCGLTAYGNAMRIMGVDLSWDECKALVGTTSRGGTTRAGMIRGIESSGFDAVAYKQRKTEPSWRWIRKWLKTNPVILLVDDDQHWVLAAGNSNGHVIIIDPTADVKKAQNGVLLMDKTDLSFRWKHAVHYAILVKRR